MRPLLPVSWKLRRGENRAGLVEECVCSGLKFADKSEDFAPRIVQVTRGKFVLRFLALLL
jgi:hypothetical protein